MAIAGVFLELRHHAHRRERHLARCTVDERMGGQRDQELIDKTRLRHARHQQGLQQPRAVAIGQRHLDVAGRRNIRGVRQRRAWRRPSRAP